MDASTQERAITELIALWVDIYFVQGKDCVAMNLASQRIKYRQHEASETFVIVY